MNSILSELEQRFQSAFSCAFGKEYSSVDPVIRLSQDSKFGDYQSNAAMGLAKRLGDKPRTIAEKIIKHLDLLDMCHPAEIAGPGFINLRLKPEWLVQKLQTLFSDLNLGLEKASQPQTVVVDYSGPNIAKQMHVGHIRSTIIGDVIARVLEFLGHRVIRQNHIGDWGTQFGMLICHLFETFRKETVKGESLHISDMEDFYKQAHQRFNSDPDFSDRTRKTVVALQSGDSDALHAWKVFRAESLRHCQEIYEELGVTLSPDDVRGESDYNAFLPNLVNALLEKQIAELNDGAVCIFLDGFKTKDNTPLPLIIRKSDGGYLYATTDLAAIQFRTQTLHADRIIYVTDSRQDLHFQQIFSSAQKIGLDVNPLTQKPVRLQHVMFGTILGEDKKPLKTRSGENVKLKDLLVEAVARSRAVVEEKNAELSESEKNTIARAVGIAAIKYADLSQNLISDYIFSFDKMLALEGNTAPYLMYAYARIRSIGRKGGVDWTNIQAEGKIALQHQTEIALSKKILQWSDIISDVAENLKPNLITSYLYELCQAFSSFYEQCPVLKNDDAQLRISRIMLCDLTARTLKTGLNLLGVGTLEQM